MNNKFSKTLVALALTSILSACGGSSGGDATPEPESPDPVAPAPEQPANPDPSPEVLTGTYVDSPVAGLAYSCGSQEGVTDTEGTFNYQAGDTCAFSLNGLSLGTTGTMTADTSVITPYDTAQDEEQAVKIASLLQTLDTDGDPDNGINIEVAAPLPADLLQMTVERFTTELREATGLEPVSPEQAKQHMDKSLGAYKGYHSAAVQQVIADIQLTAQSDIQELDLDAKLTQYQQILASSDTDNRDVATLQAVLSIITTLNNPALSEWFELDDDAPAGGLLTQVVDNLVSPKAIVLSDNTQGMTNEIADLYFSIAQNLVASADALGESFSDPAYVAMYDEDPDFHIDNEKAQSLRATAYALASGLSHIAAYNYASEDYYLPQTFEVAEFEYDFNTVTLDGEFVESGKRTTTMEFDYIPANIEPQILLSDETLFSLKDDAKYLATAKAALIQATKIAADIEQNLDEEATPARLELRDFLLKLNVHLAAEDGAVSPLVLQDDADSLRVNLHAALDKETAIDRTDFNIDASVACRGSEYDEALSKMIDDVACAWSYEAFDEVYLEDSWEERSDTAVTYNYYYLYVAKGQLHTTVEPVTGSDIGKIILSCEPLAEATEQSQCSSIQNYLQ